MLDACRRTFTILDGREIRRTHPTQKRTRSVLCHRFDSCACSTFHTMKILSTDKCDGRQENGRDWKSGRTSRSNKRAKAKKGDNSNQQDGNSNWKIRAMGRRRRGDRNHAKKKQDHGVNDDKLEDNDEDYWSDEEDSLVPGAVPSGPSSSVGDGDDDDDIDFDDRNGNVEANPLLFGAPDAVLVEAQLAPNVEQAEVVDMDETMALHYGEKRKRLIVMMCSVMVLILVAVVTSVTLALTRSDGGESRNEDVGPVFAAPNASECSAIAEGTGPREGEDIVAYGV